MEYVFKKVCNMSKNDTPQFAVKFPQKETAVAILGKDGAPFESAVVGITYPYADYHIRRPATTSTNVFEYILEGEGRVLIDGTWRRAKAGSCYILRQGEPHDYCADPQSPWEKVWINYEAGYLPAFLDAYGIQSGIYAVEGMRTYFVHALEQARKHHGAFIGHDIADYVHQIIRAAARERLSREPDEYRIKQALHASVYEKLNLDILAEKLHMSKSNLIRVYKKSYGVTPYEYLLSLKMHTAEILLKDTRMTVKEIAAELQIQDEHYFSSLFLARVGMRPKQYRSLHGN